jgi:predicted ATPase/tRNA A-37 threonylcarbamoyl transferase component Bud32
MPLTAGSRVGPYEIVSLLGSGGMGEVYLALDPRLRRQVAIKVLRPGSGDDDLAKRRLLREAQTAARLDHPNICTVYEVGEDDGRAFIVMQFIEGETLASRLSRKSLDAGEALAIATRVAEALVQAHRHGITHRDIKPQNIMLSGRDQVKVLDFGLAKITRPLEGDGETQSVLTRSSAIAGTVPYMSPEQVRGEPLDGRSDIFSFGSVLHEMMTGRHPFAGSNAADTISAILTRDTPPLMASGTIAIPELQRIVGKCLEKDRERRYQTPSDLAIDLENLRRQLDRPAPAIAPPAAEPPGVSLKAPTLPTARTPLVGRDAECAAARRLLLQPDARLVTFTGAGGTGKTRLALQVASDLVPAFEGRVYFANLGAVKDPDLVVPTVAQVLGVREIGNRSPMEAVTEAIAASSKPLLLVLDNFEQLMSAAPLVSDLLERCANLKILVTSRAVLRVYGEHDFEVPPLALPNRVACLSVETMQQSPAVALFVQRASAVKAGFALGPDNAAAVAEICARLDGLPLAIELAAARVRMLAPAAMLKRLEHRFDLLTGGARDLPARQQTLRATVEWSYGLLTAEEQKLFRRLSVFVNGCTLEAVEAVCNASEDLQVDVFDAMDSLAGQSLVQRAEQADQDTRFTMLELVREYAAEQLAASPDGPLARRAHAAYCLVLAEESRVDITRDDRSRWLARCDLEVDNFRAALDWAVRQPAAEWGLRLATGLYPYWVARELHQEGRERLTSLLALPADGATPETRLAAVCVAGDLLQNQAAFDAARSLYEEALTLSRQLDDSSAALIRGLSGLAVLEIRTGRFASARSALEQCLALSQQTGNEAVTARSLLNLGQVRHAEGDAAAAEALYEQAVARFTAVGDPSALAWSQMLLGDLAAEQGDAQAAAARYRNALAAFQAGDEQPGVARALLDLGVLAARQGDHAQSRALLSEALGLYRELGHRVGIARALDAFGRSAILRRRPDRALRLAGAADAIRRALGTPLFAQEERARAVQLDAARQAVGQTAAAIEKQGQTMSVHDAIEYALTEEP